MSVIHNRRHLLMLRFWHRLVRMDDDRLTKHIFNYNYSQCNRNWCSGLKLIFQKFDKVEHFNNLTECDINEISILMLEKENTDWYQEILTKPKLRTYTTFKSELHVEDYLCYITNRRSRSILSQFRIGILPLHVETGRFSNIPLDRRLCACCNLNVIEDEYHFLMICSKYENPRQTLISIVSDMYGHFNLLTDRDKFVFMLQNCQKHVATYLTQAFEIRQQEMFI